MPQNFKTAIIGGGISGLSAAWHLSQQGDRVDIFERSPYLGGRAREIYKDNSLFLDNGQHLLSESYLGLIKILDDCNASWRTQCHSIYPWNIYTPSGSKYLFGLSQDSLKFSDSINLLQGLFSKNFTYNCELEKKFIEPFARSVFALNAREVPTHLLKKYILKFIKNPKLYFPLVSLSDLIINPLYNKLNKHSNVNIFLSTPVLSISSTNNSTHLIQTKSGTLSYDRLIFALPPRNLKHLFSNIPTVKQVPISTSYYKAPKMTQNIKPQIIINPRAGTEWEIQSKTKTVYISSGESTGFEQNIDDEKFIKSVHMKNAVTDITCANLPKLKDFISTLPYEFIGDWNQSDEACTIESACQSALSLKVMPGYATASHLI